MALKNPMWSALTTRHSDMAIGSGGARRYPFDRTRLAGLESWTPENLRSLHATIDKGERVGFFIENLSEVPLSDWSVVANVGVTQMILNQCKQPGDKEMQSAAYVEQPEIVVLTADDVPEMEELASLTKPGPFGKRTIEFGTFLGIKLDGRLAAMAGERMKIAPNFDEVSAVCTHPDFQGRGYAKLLVRRVVNSLIERKATPFLHVASLNAPAIRSYEAIGFEISNTFNLLMAEAK